VIGLGTCNIDFILKVPRFVHFDDEVDVKNLLLSLGGSASNFTVALSRFNVKTGIMARIGNDYFGTISEDRFKGEGVDILRLLKVDQQTGMVFIAVDLYGERSMYSFMGANAKFNLEKGDIDYIKASKILHITGMYKEVVDKASKYANFLSLNLGTILSSYGLDELEKIIKRAHIIFLNKKEITQLTGMNPGDGAKILLDMGVEMVVITFGKNGARLYTKKNVFNSHRTSVRVIDTTGAGDTFAAGFIASLLKGKKLLYCLDFANQVASYCVTRLGGMNAPRLSIVDDF
jgi:alpha-D-ribose-1-phosphate 5-kinase (ATP)